MIHLADLPGTKTKRTQGETIEDAVTAVSDFLVACHADRVRHIDVQPARPGRGYEITLYRPGTST